VSRPLQEEEQRERHFRLQLIAGVIRHYRRSTLQRKPRKVVTVTVLDSIDVWLASLRPSFESAGVEVRAQRAAADCPEWRIWPMLLGIIWRFPSLVESGIRLEASESSRYVVLNSECNAADALVRRRCWEA
jgi:hypothetical protein